MNRKHRMILGLLLVIVLSLSLTGIAAAEDPLPPPDPRAPAEEPAQDPAPPPPARAPSGSPLLGRSTFTRAHTPGSTSFAPMSGLYLPRVAVPGTTLSAYKTADGYMEREYHWTIDKSVTPDGWDFFTGDSGASRYTITVTKDEGTDTYGVSGEICALNGGASPTLNLAIVDEVQYNTGGGTGFLYLTHMDVDVSAHPVLDPGEEYCYPYEIEFSPVPGAEYRNVAHLTIENHSGWEPGDNNCPGPELCPFGPDPKTDFSIPGTPSVVINDSINVDDTNGGSWPFSDDGSVSYDKTFTCSDEGNNDNTATIRETGDDDDARVVVACYDLEVSKDASTSFDRTYNWSIDKSADASTLTLQLDQSWLVNYTVTVDMTGYVDDNFAVSGSIDVYNPAPMSAVINGVEDVITTDIDATVDCGVTFPYTLGAGSTLTCGYSADLPDATTRTNTATATLQNYDYDYEGTATADGTTDFDGTAEVSFAGATITEIDECITVTDSYAGTLGVVCYGVDTLPKSFNYSRTVGPYGECGTYRVTNVAAFTGNDTGTGDNDSWAVAIDVPCNGCTLTIGYWKNHAGFGPQADVVTPLLPVWLGNAGGAKSIQVTTNAQAVLLLSFYGSDGVFAPSNGINKLYAQLLGARLNIASGADPTDVVRVIRQANRFLESNDSTDWDSLTRHEKNNVLQWMRALDEFNNGFTGPGHCSE